MLKVVVGAVVGLVLGVVFGASVIAPRLGPEVQDDPAVLVEQVAKETLSAPSVDSAKPSATTPLAPGAAARPALRWRMASGYAASVPVLGSLAKRLETQMWRVSAGTLELKFHEPGSLVPAEDTFAAVASGTIEAAFEPVAAWGDKAPAFRLFGGVPFGPPADELLAWLYFGDGRMLLDALQARHNLFGVPCGITAAAAAGWFRDPILTLDDLKGRRVAIDGLGAATMARLGIATVPLRGGDLLAGLEQREVDGAVFSMPAVDRKVGFADLARHYYFPGWQQPAALLELIVNLDQWQGLSSARKAQIETACGDSVRHGLAQAGAEQFTALKALAEQGVRLERWPAEILDALRTAWAEEAAEEATANVDFREAWQSLRTFRADYAVWRELARP